MDLDKSKRIIAATTEGPWRVTTAGAVESLTGEFVADTYEESGGETDAAFIAHARTAMPELVAEVERLRKALEDVPCEHQREGYLRAMRRAEAAEATVERVRALADARERGAAGDFSDAGFEARGFAAAIRAALEPR